MFRLHKVNKEPTVEFYLDLNSNIKFIENLKNEIGKMKMCDALIFSWYAALMGCSKNCLTPSVRFVMTYSELMNSYDIFINSNNETIRQFANLLKGIIDTL